MSYAVSRYYEARVNYIRTLLAVLAGCEEGDVMSSVNPDGKDNPIFYRAPVGGTMGSLRVVSSMVGDITVEVDHPEGISITIDPKANMFSVVETLGEVLDKAAQSVGSTSWASLRSRFVEYADTRRKEMEDTRRENRMRRYLEMRKGMGMEATHALEREVQEGHTKALLVKRFVERSGGSDYVGFSEAKRFVELAAEVAGVEL